MGYINEGRDNGLNLAAGGSRKFDKGYFIEPTIVTGLKEGTRLVDEEQFGPVMPIIKYSDQADAIARANDSPFGLGGSVWSSNEDKAADIAGQIQAGTVWINAHTPQLSCNRNAMRTASSREARFYRHGHQSIVKTADEQLKVARRCLLKKHASALNGM